METRQKIKTALGVIVRDEPDLPEWISYHFLAGFSAIYIYDNNPEQGTLNYLERHFQRLRVIPFPGEAQQHPFLKRFLEDHGKNYDWISCLDADEYLHLGDRWENLSAFLSTQHESVDAFFLPWVMFGSCGHIHRPSGLVIDNYLYRFEDNEPLASQGQDTKMTGFMKDRKWLVKPKNLIESSIHPRKLKFTPKTRRQSTNRSLSVYHFHHKSREDYLRKTCVPLADKGTPREGSLGVERWDLLNPAKIFDDSLQRRFSQAITLKLNTIEKPKITNTA